MICGFQSMTSQDKYDKCVLLLSEIHDIAHILIETGVDGELNALQIIEEAIGILKTVETNNVAHYPPLKDIDNKKEKKIIH